MGRVGDCGCRSVYRYTFRSTVEVTQIQDHKFGWWTHPREEYSEPETEGFVPVDVRVYRRNLFVLFMFLFSFVCRGGETRPRIEDTLSLLSIKGLNWTK